MSELDDWNADVRAFAAGGARAADAIGMANFVGESRRRVFGQPAPEDEVAAVLLADYRKREAADLPDGGPLWGRLANWVSRSDVEDALTDAIEVMTRGQSATDDAIAWRKAARRLLAIIERGMLP